jgi:hypothetical protein
MTTAQTLSLLLAASIALNVAVAAALTARHTGAGTGQAVLTGAGAAATTVSIYLAAVTAYHCARTYRRTLSLRYLPL